jgi:hypothetical protein
MFEPVQPVPAAPPATSGLVRSAQVVNNPGERWEQGIAWISERCPVARSFDPCGDASSFGEPVGEGSDGVVYYRPSAFRVEDECSTRSLIDEGRVRRQALAATSYMAARELHTGERSLANPYVTPHSGDVADQVNHYLAEPTATVVSGEWAIMAAIGQLEDAARDATLGQDVFIHMPVAWVPLMSDAVSREGNLLRTKTGAIVVADAGYPGTGPEDIGTSEVQTVTITGDPTGGDFTLIYDGEETTPIAFDAAATAVQSALNALSNLDGVAVTGDAGGPYTVTFPLAMGNADQLGSDDTGLTGGTAPTVDVVTTTAGVPTAPLAGSWLYATGPVQVRLSDVVVQRIDNWAVNSVLMTAERLFAATFDPCTLHAIQITPPEPTP